MTPAFLATLFEEMRLLRVEFASLREELQMHRRRKSKTHVRVLAHRADRVERVQPSELDIRHAMNLLRRKR
jgi:hypothetical protein